MDFEDFGPGQEILNLSLAVDGGFMVRTDRWFSGYELDVFQGRQRGHLGVRSALLFGGLERGTG